MKPKILPLIISIPCLTPIILMSFANLASAQCVRQQQGIQLDISQQQNTNQTNDIKMSGNPSCTGNTSSSDSTQVNIGGDGASQHIRGRHSTTSNQPNPSGVNGPSIDNTVIIPVRVKTPNTPIEFP